MSPRSAHSATPRRRHGEKRRNVARMQIYISSDPPHLAMAPEGSTARPYNEAESVPVRVTVMVPMTAGPVATWIVVETIMLKGNERS